MINNQLQPIVSDDLTLDTEKPETLKKVAKSAAIGAGPRRQRWCEEVRED